MSFVIDPELRAFIPPLTTAERDALATAIVSAGRATEALVTATIDGRETLLDGHNRYDICTAKGLPYETRSLGAMSRDEAKAWMFQYQIARRNLSTDQVLALAAARGVDAPANTGTARLRAMAAELAEHDPAALARVIASGMLAMRWGAWARKAGRLPSKAPRPPRGPSTAPAIPEGHELAGVSTLTDDTGATKAAWNKTRVAGADAPPTAVPDTHLVKRTATLQRGDGSTVAQWVTTAADEVARETAMRDAWARHAAVYAGLAGTSAVPTTPADADLCALYPLGDPHIGMLSWAPESGTNWDLGIAARHFLACMRELVASAPPAERAIVVNLGDFLHAQDDMNVTPGHGNKLDVEGRFAKVLDTAHALMRGMVDAALAKHRHVTVRNLPGNHDPRVAAEISMWLRAVYEQEPRVTVADAYAAHQYDRFGATLIGWAHGDRGPGKELPAIMAVDQAAAWGETLFHVWHTGHVHHESTKEYPGCDVESHGILPPGDAWHAGRYRSRRRMSVITLHRDYGEIARATVGIERVRAALRATENGKGQDR